MNKNNRRQSKGKLPVGLFLGIIFFLLSGTPQLIPFIIIAAVVVLSLTKGARGNYNFVDKFVKRNEVGNTVDKKVTEIKNINDIKDIIVTDDISNLEGYKNKTDFQKRLEMLKTLYDNGFMDRSEYEEKRKKVTGGK